MKTTVLDSLNQGLISALKADSSVHLLGEDILDPYGGAFKVTRGCSTAFSMQVIPTPISEAGLAGVTAGMALRGLRPVLEIMFGDFTTLIADQLINHISKFRWMYNDSVTLPLVIRTPMGGRRGYGPTHSQSLEKLFMGVPGLTVLVPANFSVGIHSPGSILENTILNTDSPVLFIENKMQYLQPLLTAETLADFEVDLRYDPTDINQQYPIYCLSIKGAPSAAVTISAYGFCAELARQAQLKLAFEEEIFTELIIPTRLSPFALQPLMDVVARTGKILLIEEGTRSLGWGAEVGTLLAETLGDKLKQVKRLAALETPVPAAVSLETGMLPQQEDIEALLRKMSA
ncbi:MAG: alpha-ketoacid dehydrogenase subunit beta [Chloroflexi bacterium HGW-Chloroflexi-4]|jgi:pyruvate/2-oxoglutarate/acetoin dehydrogenase E1 component|nr:MAG: alpha-ketoacid dehydrogenase subunit beta [Chloroflexi bacterium HGW-Chloroflexi-4]